MHWKAAGIGVAAAVTIVAGGGLPATAAPAAGGYRYARAVDGDTIQLSDGRYVRLLGYDTPEVGQCGYAAAKRKMQNLVSGGVRLVNVSGRDHYGRSLAYIHTRDGRDVGTVMLRKGLGVARYDGLDGYGWHPKQRKYRSLSQRSGSISCTTAPTKPSSTASFANCDAVRAAGAAPIRVGQPGYGRHLDRDGDGVGCE